MEIVNDLHLLKLDFEINFSNDNVLKRFVNCLIINDNKITLIDTGVKGSEERIFNYIKGLGRDITDIEFVILSHSHPDHIGSAARIKALTDCKVLAHVAEEPWIQDINKQFAERPVPGFFNLVDSSLHIDEALSGGERLKLSTGRTIKIIHAPGHSKGSINILFEEDKALFTADSIPLLNDIPNYDDYYDLERSLIDIRKRKDYNILLTSWSDCTSTPMETDKLLSESEQYLSVLNEEVQKCYVGQEFGSLEACRKVITNLGLPPFYINPIVDKAFRSHLITESF
jgi:glyoxylase-like metal-dependent hydrolase (beta-lactamase superfamily II)